MQKIQISEIKTTKRGRYALFCDGEFLFSVDGDTLERHALTEGAELTETELVRVQTDSDDKKAIRKALDFLALRDHGMAELRQKLLRTFDEETSDRAIDKMCEYGYVDDANFAVRYAKELFESKSASLREIRNRLWQKGIDRELIEETMEEFETDETAQIRSLMEKKYADRIEAGKTQSVVASLMRKGFAYYDIRTVLQDYREDVFEEE